MCFATAVHPARVTAPSSGIVLLDTLRCVTSAADRTEALAAAAREASACVRCAQLAAARTQVVFGTGAADAELMLVGEAPGRAEDEQGVPFAGRAGALLDELLAGIGLDPGAVFVTTALKCRPPGNRDALPGELANCQGWLHRQVELVRPRLVCALGNQATRLLRGGPEPVTRVRGRDEIRVVGGRAVRVLPLLHPAAALYAPPLLDALRADFARIPELLALPEPEQPGPPAVPEKPPVSPDPPGPDAQLGLF